MVTPPHPRATDPVAELRGLVRVLLDESGLIKPSILAAADQGPAPTITVEGLELEAGKAPTEFRIFRAGENPSTKGTFIFDEQAAASVMAAYAARGLDLMMDFEHMSLVKPPIIAPASCKRWVPQIRNGELWATECGWTNRARGMIEEGEIRYFSPAFNFDPLTMRVINVINCALTNNPALDAITPLVKASAGADDATTDENKEPAAMKLKMKCSTANCTRLTALKAVEGEEETCKAGDGEEAFCAQCRASAVLSGVGQKVITALGLTADVGEAAALSATAQLTGLRTELATLTGKDAPAAQLGMISSWKAGAEEATKLRAELAEVRTAALSTELTTMLNDAASGQSPKISPAQREALDKRTRGADGKPTAEGVAFVREWLSGAGAVVQAGEVKGPAGGIALDPQELAIARTLGQDPEQYAKWKAQKMGAVIGK